jgi:hypothetical protein
MEKYPEEQFAHDSHTVDGFSRVCKLCMEEIAREEHLLLVEQRIRTLDKASLQVLERLAVMPARTLNKSPHVLSLLEDLTQVWGGTQGFAQHLMAQYLAATPGGMIRNKLLESFIFLVHKISEAGYAKKPLSAMSDEELEAEASSRRQALLLKLGVTDGQVNLPYTGGRSAG